MKKKSNKINTSIEKKNATVAFLDKKLKDEIHRLHFETVELLKKGFENAVKIGEILNRIKLALPHGKFTGFVKKEFSYISLRTSQYYLKMYHNQDRLRDELGENLSLKAAIRHIEKPKNKKDIPANAESLKKILSEHEVKVKEAKKHLRKFLSGKLPALQTEEKQILIPMNETALEKELERLEKLSAKIEERKRVLNLLRDENATVAFLESENPDSIEAL